ncbi:hypothetical protein [Sporosarcina sp. P33]|uniref:DUF7686 domain-containing protein n=1 Tax=Sporosarcina sp. P33 TaxID=1930764 RepID=UPI0009BD8E34|nr:hypothetical protein [Sporosarcina sp. P33]ARD48864.1 hypothetical protein SporoP33_11925 [Sporosarcina sp. P33]
MKCEQCSTDKVHVQFGNQPLCMDCYNSMMAAELGIELPELPITFIADDANGVMRIFEVERMIMGTTILLTAHERREQGYEFAVDGQLDDDQHKLFKQLIEKTTRGLSETYLATGKFPSGEPYTYIKQNHLKGVLSYDSDNCDTPLVIIDGKPYTWNEVGRLLQAFEGFQVKMVMKELADDFE